MQPIDSVSAGHIKETITLALAALGALGILAGIVFGILNSVRKRTTEVAPNPLRVTPVAGYVDQATFEREHNMVLQRLNKVEQNYQDLREIIADQGTEMTRKLEEQSRLLNAAIGTVHRRTDDLVKVTYAVAGKLGIKSTDGV